MTPTIRRAALAAVAAGSLAGSAAWAQPDDHRGPPGDMRARMQGLREAHEGQYAQDLRTILRLRPDQEAALAAYLQSHKRPEGTPAGAPPAPMTTPQRLDAVARREAEHADMQRRHAEALRAFYAALSPEQRQVFDALQRMRGGHEHGGWGGPGGPPPPRGE